MNLQRKLIIAACVLGTILYIVGTQYNLDQQRKDSVSAYSDNGKGVSLYGDLLKSLPYGDLNIYRRPLLYYEDLGKVDALAILSPRTPISKKEAETVYQFLENGGKLILSAHDQDTALRLAPLLDKIAASSFTNVAVDPEFENYKVRNLVSDIDDEVFRADETYSFYSQIYFSHRPTCADRKEISCFYYSQEVGRGLVFYFLGLPILSNGLINNEFNRFFAYRMARLAPRLVIDEYHHHFPTKNLSEFATDWQYSLPLYGLFIGAILFFLFSRNPHEMRGETAIQAKSLHDVGEKLLVQHLSHPNVIRGAREKYKKYLEKKFPHWVDDIDYLYNKHFPQIHGDDTRVKVQTRDFIKLHQKLIRMKKGESRNVVRQPDRNPDL